MSQWKGKTRGGLIGHKIFVWVMKYLGLSFAYFILFFVALYFFLFVPKSFRTSYFYFRHIHKYSWFKAIRSIYWNYYRFGQVILDKVAILAGFSRNFTFDFDGREHLREMVRGNKGGLLISAHAGNWEVAAHFLNELKGNIHVVMFDGEHQQIKNYLSDVMVKKNIQIIVVKNDLNHIFKINQALQNNEIVCIHGDRFIEGRKTMICDFFNRPARFPMGPFHMAVKFDVPVAYVFAFKEKSRHYHFYTRPALQKEQGLEAIAQEYADTLESVIRTYPLQWFNYYPFWETNT